MRRRRRIRTRHHPAQHDDDRRRRGGETTSTTEEPDSTTTSEGQETTTTEEATTTTAPETTTTEVVTTTTTAEVTTTTAAPTTTAAEGDRRGRRAARDAGADRRRQHLVVVARGGAGRDRAHRIPPVAPSHGAPPWADRARAYADEVDAAGRSVLLGPDLTQELWTTALASSNEVRARADDLLDHAPSTAARQAVSEAVEALRQAEVQATAARSGVGGSGDRDLAAAELAAAVERLRAAAAPAMPAAP